MMQDLMIKAWEIYRKFEKKKFIVTPSIPILYFGDSEKYFKSEIKVITVGLNPSKNEFPANNKFSRFKDVKEVYPVIINSKILYKNYKIALDNYFKYNPYESWFNFYEKLLNGLDCSYWPKGTNIALHTDLFSPLATDPTWSKLLRQQKTILESDGINLWHHLIEYLSPDIIIVSISKHYLENIKFLNVINLKIIYTIERENPYEIKCALVKLKSKTSFLFFEIAAQKPFSTVSHQDKFKIGRNIKRYTSS